MFLRTVKSDGLAHLSYVFGDKGKAVVIDPRRDCEIYVRIAQREGARITNIFETHRNEDYIIGSLELKEMTGAEIHHGKELPFAYGSPVDEGDIFRIGDILLTVLKTPGHTYESISLVLSDTGFGPDAIGVFTGDALFIGDVGRTDFIQGEDLLYDSLFSKILPLGDQAILYPAHGRGSVCGAGLASREFSTLGYERRHNPILKLKNREEFIRVKQSERHESPPYFKKMEELNLNGAPILGFLPRPKSIQPEEFASAMEEGMLPIDVREPEAFAGAHVPGSFSLPLDMIASYAGWFLDYDRDIGLVADTIQAVEEAVRQLIRIGYDRIQAYLAGGLHKWEATGLPHNSTNVLSPQTIRDRIESGKEWNLVDVRKEEEYESGHPRGAIHIPLGLLPDKIDRLDKDQTIATFCGSGRRAMIASSILEREGFQKTESFLGALGKCREIGCPMVSNE